MHAVTDQQASSSHTALLTLSAISVGGLSYLCSLLLVHLLAPPQFTAFAGAQALLTVVGTTSAALVPLPLARAIRTSAATSQQRSDLLAGAVVTSLSLGLVAACVAGLIGSLLLPPGGALATAISTFGFFAVAPIWGLLQGKQRLREFAALTVLEATVRVCGSVVAASLGWGATGAVLGWALGSLLAILVGVALQREEFRSLLWRARKRLPRADLMGVMSVQVISSLLAVVDVLIVAAISTGTSESALYQLLSTISRAPVYVATAAVVVYFPQIRSLTQARSRITPAALRDYAALAIPASIVLAGAPQSLVDLVAPEPTGLGPWVVVLLAITGLAWGALTVCAFIEHAAGRSVPTVTYLLATAITVIAAVLIGWRMAGFLGISVGTALVSVAAVLPALTRVWAGAGRAAKTRSVVALSAAVAIVLIARSSTIAWAVTTLMLGLLVMARLLRQPASETSRTADARPRVAHFAFEDPLMPGAGGGAVRTWEISRRLSDRFNITLYCQRWPGAVARLDEGVRVEHVGVGSGASKLSRWLGYTVALPFRARRVVADLIVEDFFAPFASIGLPRYGPTPTIAVVQWLNADEKQSQYHLPLAPLERFGVKAHHEAIAVSQGIADKLVTLNPTLHATVVPNAVDPSVFSVAPRERSSDVLFVGRFDIEHKGLDLLLEAWATVGRQIEGHLLLAGNGPDGDHLRAEVERLGLCDDVMFLGWLDSEAKYEAMATARLVVMPSRYETFGLVALESLAVGTPVVAFDIPCLREVLPPDCSLTVADMTPEALGRALLTAHTDEVLRAHTQHRGPILARTYDWDAVADQQAEVYARALTHPRSPG